MAEEAMDAPAPARRSSQPEPDSLDIPPVSGVCSASPSTVHDAPSARTAPLASLSRTVSSAQPVAADNNPTSSTHRPASGTLTDAVQSGPVNKPAETCALPGAIRPATLVENGSMDRALALPPSGARPEVSPDRGVTPEGNLHTGPVDHVPNRPDSRPASAQPDVVSAPSCTARPAPDMPLPPVPPRPHVPPVGDLQLPPAQPKPGPLGDILLPPASKPLTRVSENGEFQLPAAKPALGETGLTPATPRHPVGVDQNTSGTRPLAVSGNATDKQPLPSGTRDPFQPAPSNGTRPSDVLVSLGNNITSSVDVSGVGSGSPANRNLRPGQSNNGDGREKAEECGLPGSQTPGLRLPVTPGGGNPAAQGDTPAPPAPPAPLTGAVHTGGREKVKDPVAGAEFIAGMAGSVCSSSPAPSPDAPTGRPRSNGGVPSDVPPGVTQNEYIAHVGQLYNVRPVPSPAPARAGEDAFVALPGGSPRPHPQESGSSTPGGAVGAKLGLNAEFCRVGPGGQPIDPVSVTVVKPENIISEMARRIPSAGAPTDQSGSPRPPQGDSILLPSLVNIARQSAEPMQLPTATRAPQQLVDQLKDEPRRPAQVDLLPVVAQRGDRHVECDGPVCPVTPRPIPHDSKPTEQRAVELLARLTEMLNSREQLVARDTNKQDPDSIVRIRPIDLSQWTAPQQFDRSADRVSERLAERFAIDSPVKHQVEIPAAVSPAFLSRQANTELARASIASVGALEPSRLSDVLGRVTEPQPGRVPADKTIDQAMQIPADLRADAGRSGTARATTFPADGIDLLPAGGLAADGRLVPGRTIDGRIIPGVLADGRIITADGRIIAADKLPGETRQSNEGRFVSSTHSGLPEGKVTATADGRFILVDGKVVAADGKMISGPNAQISSDARSHGTEQPLASTDKGGKNIVVDPVLGPVRVIVTPSGETVLVPVDQNLVPGEKPGDRKDVIDKGGKKKDKDTEEDEEKEKELAVLLNKGKDKKPDAKDQTKADDKTTKQPPTQVRRKYIVRPGDTVESIASAQLNDERFSVLICIINRAVIKFEFEGAKSTAKLRVGQILWLPSPLELQVHRSMFFANKKSSVLQSAHDVANGASGEIDTNETVAVEEIKLPEIHLTNDNQIDTVTLAPAINKPLPPVAKPLPEMLSDGRPTIRISADSTPKVSSSQDRELAEKNLNLLLGRIADVVASANQSQQSTSTPEQVLLDRIATVIAHCTTNSAAAAGQRAYLPSALRPTGADQGGATTVLMQIQSQAGCVCRVITVENTDQKAFSTRLQISANQTDWTTVASYECGEKTSVRYLNKGDGKVDAFTMRLPSAIVRNMASQDLMRNWQNYVMTFAR